MARPRIRIVFRPTNEERLQIRTHFAKHECDGGRHPGGLLVDPRRNGGQEGLDFIEGLRQVSLAFYRSSMIGSQICRCRSAQ